MIFGRIFLGIFLISMAARAANGLGFTSSIAAIEIRDSKTFDREYCTGFLVSPNEVMTASHCLTQPELDCQKDVAILFGKKKVKCEAITYNSQASIHGNSLDLDYAVLKITPALTDREPLKISVDGLKDEEDVDVYAMDRFKLQKKSCRVYRQKFAAFIHPNIDPLNFKHPQSPFILVAGGDDQNCELRKGNSGSAMVDSKGFVKGVLRAVAQKSESKSFFLSVISGFTCARFLPGLKRDALPEICGVLNKNKTDQTLFGNGVGDPPRDQYVDHYVSDKVSHEDHSENLPAKSFDRRL